ncbi:zinc-binding alcohol dehydrogenase family protein [Archangium violaceum]|uniref:zinc-binding alcohol dehydrogenase family protein n=1 Tax=Archangium violaceum TaxID=83451 RepID=UPI002B294166|nr:zinc-binding alcohol dehydrogenase family protein [Archangium gephyra]
MKALAYTKAHPLTDFQIKDMEVPRPALKPHDVLMEVKAFSINPVDFKVRGSRTLPNGEPVILGWDAAGVVVEVGPEAKGFKVGDEVYGAGDLTRSGSYGELYAIDSRIIARKPRSLSFTEAAALPLTALTAWEALIARPELELGRGSSALVIGGAGGVGSIAIQLLKQKTQAKVIATASRPETIEWCSRMGADATIDHRKDLEKELERIGIKEVDAIFSTTHSDTYAGVFPKILRPFGNLSLIDDPKTLDIVPFKRKSISVHWELMFTKTLLSYRLESQGEILKELAQLVDEGKIKTTANTILKGATAEHLRFAHEMSEQGKGVGKIVIER